jgi:6-phosphofructokinase 2
MLRREAAMKTILTITINPALDLFLEVPHLVADRKMRCGTPAYLPGGGGVNVSRAIRHLGGESTALFLAGGMTGDLLTTLLQRESIATNCIRIAEPTRENVNVLDRGSGKEYRFIVPGPDVGQEEWMHCLRAVRSITPRPDYVVASGALPPGVPVDFYGRLAALAKATGFKLLIDTSGEPLRHAAALGTFLLKPNAGELAAIADGGGPFGTGLLEGAARAIIDTGRSEVVVISAGAGGAIVVDSAGPRRVVAPVVPIASRVGAGDSMMAGIVLALARGSDIDEAVTFGVAAGTAAVMRPGHQLCTREETERLFKAMRAQPPVRDDRGLQASVA